MFPGAGSVSLDAAGNLVLATSGGDVIEQAPIIYQEIDGVRQAVDGGYVLETNGRVGFRVGSYDRSQPLVIDPVLVYSTYLGGSGSGHASDGGNAIAVDAAGNTYVTGFSASPDFPTLDSLQGPSASGSSVAFVTKFDPTGAVVYSTYIGGSGAAGSLGPGLDFVQGDGGNAIAVDATGNAYITGYTRSIDFPTTANALQAQPVYDGVGLSLGAQTNAFVAELNAAGTALVYSTYLGGGGDSGTGIAVDVAGSAYVTGTTTSFVFPTTAGAFQAAPADASSNAFVVKLSPGGTSLVYSTYLGGDATSFTSGYGTPENGNGAAGIAVDGSGSAYVTGFTDSADFPTTAGALQPSGGSAASSAFVTKLNPQGTGLVYSTYLGGSTANDMSSGGGIAVDGAGNAYVTGSTFAADFPTTAGALQVSKRGLYDGQTGNTTSNAFVAKLNATGTGLVYSTYLGGSGFGNEQSASGDHGAAIAVDASGNAHVTGQTASADFPTVDAVQPSFGGDDSNASFPSDPIVGDAFVATLNASGTALVNSTYLGGSGPDAGKGIAVDAAGNSYVTGVTSSSNLRTLNAFQPQFQGSDVLEYIDQAGQIVRQYVSGDVSNAFVAKIAPQGPGVLEVHDVPLELTEGVNFSGVVASFTDTDTDGAGSYAATIDWGDGQTSTGTIAPSGVLGEFTVTAAHTYADEGAYAFTVTVSDADGSIASTAGSGVSTAAAVTYHIAIDTSALAGSAGSLDFQFNPGGLPDAQAADAAVINFASIGGALTGAMVTGAASRDHWPAHWSSRTPRCSTRPARGSRLAPA